MKNSVSAILREARISRSTLAAVSGLAAPLALAAPGDLDPTFGDVGRISPLPDVLDSPLWSIEPQDDGYLLGGGEYNYSGYCFYCYYDYYSSGFTGRVDADGLTDPAFATAEIGDIQVLDVALQPDGKAIGVGRSELDGSSQLTVFRLEPDGALDTTFGDEGIVRFAPNGGTYMANAVALEPDGRVVVAGSVGDDVIVLRLLADGAVDEDFGASGVFTVPFNGAAQVPARILRTAAGAYRVSTNPIDLNCAVIGVTADGTLDLDFGANGVAVVGDPPLLCRAMISQTDDRLLLAGDGEEGVAAVRLLDSGDPDPSFSVEGALETPIEHVTALGVDPTGSVLLAGRGAEGVPAAVIVRLQANGELDTLFGDAGTTWIDLPAPNGAPFDVNDMAFTPDGGVIVAGGDNSRRTGPALARLQGDGGEDSPGVLGVMQPIVAVDEAEGEAVVTVRRTGGRAGEVSIEYETRSLGTDGPGDATAADDYTDVSDTLTWADGVVGEKTFVVPLAPDGPEPEEEERFQVVLKNVQGGAGVGTEIALVQINADGAPAGQFSVEALSPTVREVDGVVEVLVSRNFYFEGPVSVTLTPIAGTATGGDDFEAEPVELTWLDGEGHQHIVQLAINNDTVAEGAETFRLELTAPTGGAIIGPRATAEVTIAMSDQPANPPQTSTGGGGGSSSSLLLLAVSGLIRLLGSTRRRTRLAFERR